MALHAPPVNRSDILVAGRVSFFCLTEFSLRETDMDQVVQATREKVTYKRPIPHTAQATHGQQVMREQLLALIGV